MAQCPFAFINDRQRHVICLVGGGGKTTVMYELAAAYAMQGRRVLVCTSTHIQQPQAAVWAKCVQEAQGLWRSGSYAVIGEAEVQTGKLTAPSQKLYAVLAQESDIVLCEADGAKRLPCKLPAAHEPVLLTDCDIVLAVAGMDALDKTLAEACFRPQLAEKLFAKQLCDVIDERFLAQVLLSPQGTRKNVGEHAFFIVLNKCDVAGSAQIALLRQLLLVAGMEAGRIWLRGEMR
jgi:probable selenium-dependent hydroxylase accessory protein YqeC